MYRSQMKFIFDRLRGAKQFIKNEFMLFNFCFVFFFIFFSFFREDDALLDIVVVVVVVVVFSFILSFSPFVTSRMTRMIARGVNYKLFSLVFNFVKRKRFSFLGALSTSSLLLLIILLILHLIRVTWDSRLIKISNWVGEGKMWLERWRAMKLVALNLMHSWCCTKYLLLIYLLFKVQKKFDQKALWLFTTLSKAI